MAKLSKYFRSDEYGINCHDGTPVPKKYMKNLKRLCKNMDVVREHYGKPITVTSCYRHPVYNRSRGGGKKSQHLTASAMDFVVKGVNPLEVAETVKALIADGQMDPGGVGTYPGFTHYDIRGRNARWRGG